MARLAEECLETKQRNEAPHYQIKKSLSPASRQTCDDGVSEIPDTEQKPDTCSGIKRRGLATCASCRGIWRGHRTPSPSRRGGGPKRGQRTRAQLQLNVQKPAQAPMSPCTVGAESRTQEAAACAWRLRRPLRFKWPDCPCCSWSPGFVTALKCVLPKMSPEI